MTLWVVKGGQHGEQEERILQNSVLAIGWPEIPDLSTFSTRKTLKAAYQATYPQDSEGKRNVQVGQLWAFGHAMAEGDLALVPLKTRGQIAVGTVVGPYRYQADTALGADMRHTRPVNWIRTDFPRTAFDQDLLYSFGAFMTVSTVRRNNAEARVWALVKGTPPPAQPDEQTETIPAPDGALGRDLEQDGQDQIIEIIRRRFKGHGLARVVNGILRAQGFATRMSPPGPDGGVDIVAAGGTLGFDAPRIVIQVKSSDAPADASVLRALKGTMSDYGADQGILVSWGGFKHTLQGEARTGYFKIRLWDQTDLLRALFANYDRLDDELRAELPIKRIWAVAQDAAGES